MNPSYPAEVSDLVELSIEIGGVTPLWVQGAGGNLSCKLGATLWIKQSGLRLDSVSMNSGIAQIQLDGFSKNLREIFKKSGWEAENEYSSQIKASSFSGRASMETGFHAVLGGKYVIHFHAISALLMEWHNQQNSQKFGAWLKTNLPKNESFSFLPSIVPGLSLSKSFDRESSTTFTAIKNHGIVIFGNDGHSLLKKWKKFENQFLKDFKYTSLLNVLENPSPWEHPLVSESLKKPFPNKVYFPDTALFLNEILNRKNATNLNRNLQEIWSATVLLFELCPSLPEVPFEQQAQIANLPVEIYRKKVNPS